MSSATVQYTDYSNENSATKFNVIDMSAVDWANARQSIDSMLPLIDALSSGTRRRVTITDETIGYNDDNPVIPTAQREVKALVTYADVSTSKRYQMNIPVFNYDGVVPNTDVIDVSVGAWPAFVTGLEANVLSEVGNAVEFIQAVLVGRNL